MLGENLHADFETRSVVDLKKHGLFIYARHASTDAWCMSWAFDDEPVALWKKGEPLPRRIREHVEAGGTFTGHNVIFEFIIWNEIMAKRYGWPLMSIRQLEDTMAMGYAMAFPGTLKGLADGLQLANRKDNDGRALMLSMAKPRDYDPVTGAPIWWDVPDKIFRLGSYCMQDTLTEREADKCVVRLSPREKELWVLDARVNARGMGVDRKAVQAALKLIARIKLDLDAKIKVASEGKIIATSQATAILEFIREEGHELENLRKNSVKAFLDRSDLPADVREIVQLRADGAKASLAKLETMLDVSMDDGRARGQFQYHGASTGRWAGRSIQLHNLPRPEEDWSDPDFQDKLLAGISAGKVSEQDIELVYGAPMHVLSSLVRGFLIAAPGCEYIGADLANIEGRVLAWLAGEEWKLDAFRAYDGGTGPDLYKLAAARIYKNDVAAVSKPERQIGKVSELSMGYQGGVGAFQQMAVNYGVSVSNDIADQIKVAWRAANPAITHLWSALEKAAMAAVRNPGVITYASEWYDWQAQTTGKLNIPDVRRIQFRVAGSFLWMLLPTGRALCYPYPKIEMVDTSWGTQKEAVTFMGTSLKIGGKMKKGWFRQSTYGGKLAENATQAVARDVLADGMLAIEPNAQTKYPIVLHVHDEIASEVPAGSGDVKEYEWLMTHSSPWATDMPITAEGWRGRRYRK